MRAFFLDRDGVINKGHNVNDPLEFEFIEGSIEAIVLLNELDYHVFVVTNQAGVSLGYISKEQLEAVHNFMVSQVNKAGGHITEVKTCMHRPRQGCTCRKPKPGMIVECIEKYSIAKEHSFMVGDRDIDVLAGQAAGVNTVLISDSSIGHIEPHYRYSTLIEAVTDLKDQGVIASYG